MSWSVFVAVLTAAALHATWNALVKNAGDKYLSMSGVVVGHVPFAAAALLFVPMPQQESWPYILSGAALHVGYQLFLLMSYRIGDLTQVYPIARGIAPLIVAVVSTTILGVQLSSPELAAIGLIAVGIMSLVLVRGSDGLHNPRAAMAALVTGCFIASYSLNDGLGARAAASPVAFYAWLSIINAVAFSIIIAVMKPGVLPRLATDGLKVTLIGGGASFLAYSLVVWGFTQAPIALVTALRETSIIFALFIGVFFLGERLNLAKLASTAITLAGVVVLRLSR